MRRGRRRVVQSSARPRHVNKFRLMRDGSRPDQIESEPHATMTALYKYSTMFY